MKKDATGEETSQEAPDAKEAADGRAQNGAGPASAAGAAGAAPPREDEKEQVEEDAGVAPDAADGGDSGGGGGAGSTFSTANLPVRFVYSGFVLRAMAQGHKVTQDIAARILRESDDAEAENGFDEIAAEEDAEDDIEDGAETDDEGAAELAASGSGDERDYRSVSFNYRRIFRSKNRAHMSADPVSNTELERLTLVVTLPAVEGETVGQALDRFTRHVAETYAVTLILNLTSFSQRLSARGWRKKRVFPTDKIGDLSPAITDGDVDPPTLIPLYVEDSYIGARVDADGAIVRWRRPKVITNNYLELVPHGFENHPEFVLIAEAAGSGFLRRCRTLCEEVLKKNEDGSVLANVARIVLARLYLESNRLEKAREVMQAIPQEICENHADLMEIQAEIAMQKEQWATAAARFEQACNLLREGKPKNVQRYLHRNEGTTTKTVLRENVLAARQAEALRHNVNEIPKATTILQRILLKEADGNENSRALETYGNVVVATGFFGDGFKLKVQALTADPVDGGLCRRVCEDMRTKSEECMAVISEVLNSTIQLRTTVSASAFLAEVARTFSALEVAERIYELAMVNTPGRIQIFRGQLEVFDLRVKYVQLLQLAFDFFDTYSFEEEFVYRPIAACVKVRDVISCALDFALIDQLPGPRTRNRFSYTLKLMKEHVPRFHISFLQMQVHMTPLMHLAYMHPDEITSPIANAAMVCPFSMRNGGTDYVLPQRNPKTLLPGDKNDIAATIEDNFPGTLSEEDIHRTSALAIRPYTFGEVHVISSLLMVVKTLFLMGPGYLRFIPAIMVYIEPLRAGAFELHVSEAHAEFICYIYISRLLVSHQRFLEPFCFLVPRRRVYMLGDDHVLSSAWHEGSVKGRPYMFEPKLSSSIRCWSLRNGEDYYPRAQFDELVASIPDGSVVVFCIGDMDCREGVLEAVRKDQFESVSDAIYSCVTIYITKMIELSRKRGFSVFVHPVPPVISMLRPIIDNFNKILRAKVLQYQKYLTWVDILPGLLEPVTDNAGEDMPSLVYDGQVFKHREYGLDWLHLSSAYTDLLRDDLEPHLAKLLDEGRFPEPAPTSPGAWRKWKKQAQQAAPSASS